YLPETDLSVHVRRIGGDAHQRLVVVAAALRVGAHRGYLGDGEPAIEGVGAARARALAENRGAGRSLGVSGELAPVGGVGVVGERARTVALGIGGLVVVGDEVVEAGGLLAQRVCLEVVGEERGRPRAAHTCRTPDPAARTARRRGAAGP